MAETCPDDLSVEDWGLLDYALALERQQEKVEQVIGGSCDHLIFCSHPPVVTLGRGSHPSDLEDWQGLTLPINRGGRATYHGPHQLVMYPILNLTHERARFSARDVRAYLRSLEDWVTSTLQGLGFTEARSGSLKIEDSKERSPTGVWVGEKKVASIGVGVRRWVSFHGVALNLQGDSNFLKLRPCGYDGEVMSGLRELWPKNTPALDRDKLIQALISTFRLQFKLQEQKP